MEGSDNAWFLWEEDWSMRWFVAVILLGAVVYTLVTSTSWLGHANGDVGVMSEGYVANE